jgi:hypothetical protein
VKVSRTEVARDVASAEYARLVELPLERLGEDRFAELDRATRAWYAAHGSPWVRFRIVEAARLTPPAVARRLARSHSSQVALVAVTAGAEIGEAAAARWETRPEEAWFLDRFGAAVVEHLLARVRTALGADLPPFHAPGYAGWDLAGLAGLLRLVQADSGGPGPLAVTEGGMLTPCHALVGAQSLGHATKEDLVACDTCGLDPCTYRRPASLDPTGVPA